MNINQARMELVDIRKNLIKILDDYHKNISLNDEREKEIRDSITSLYYRYLKIRVCLDKKIPDYDNGKWPYDNNCYCYAMYFRRPDIFQKIYTDIFYEFFYNQIGDIGGNALPTYFDREKLLDALYADLDALKIRYYESSIGENSMHGGYKIALYILDREKSKTRKPNYHFIRQNSDGLWSEKDGYHGDIYVVKDPNHLVNHSNYELVRTLEIVKPNLKELSL